MEHIQHLDELVFTPRGLDTLLEFLVGIRERNEMQATLIEVSRKFDGAPAIVFGRDEFGLFLSTKAFYNVTQIKCYSQEDIYEQFGIKVGLWSTLHNVWEAIQSMNIRMGEVFQADVMFVENRTLTDEEEYSFKPNIIEYTIDADDVRKIGLCVHSKIIQTNFKNPEEPPVYIHISYDFPQEKAGNDVFLVQCPVLCVSTHEIKGVAVSDELMQAASDLHSRYTHCVDENMIELMRMLDNAIIRGEVQVGKQMNYLAAYMRFVSNRYVKDLNEYKTSVGIYKCFHKYNALINPHHQVQTIIQDMYKVRQLLRKFKLDLIEHFNHLIETNVYAEEHEGLVITFENGVVAKVVDRENFSKRNFNKNGNSFQK